MRLTLWVNALTYVENVVTRKRTPADGPPPVDYPWMAPSEPSRWKSEHVRINFFFLVRDTSPTHSLNISQTQQQVVFTVLAGWAVGLSAAKAAFGGGKKEEKK